MTASPPNNGMQRTRASAFLSCSLCGRSPLMPGVRRLILVGMMNELDALPSELRKKSLSESEIVLGYEDALSAIDCLINNRWGLHKWDGLVLLPDGKITASLDHQGTCVILKEESETWEGYMQSSAEFCRRIMEISRRSWNYKPEVEGGTLYFRLSAIHESEAK